ncbi:MAG TPA: hypothetical protein VK459_08655 [Polyangiaceae bacterium]|nr:hypothetical protein [Polyangiaceae bacterium]
MTSQAAQKKKVREVVFVDAAGGALSVLAASVAASGAGADNVPVVAATIGAPASPPAEIAAVLEEVGMRLASPEVIELKALDRSSFDRVVFLGAHPPPGLEGATKWDVALFEGEGDLERLATARIARDRIERGLERLRSAAA